MHVPEELRYSSDHEWVAVDGDRVAGRASPSTPRTRSATWSTCRSPTLGASVAAGDSFGEVESTKSVSDVYAPVSGTVVAVNEALADAPETVNRDPYGEGWLCEIELADASELEALLDARGVSGSARGLGRRDDVLRVLQPVRPPQPAGVGLLLVVWRSARPHRGPHHHDRQDRPAAGRAGRRGRRRGQRRRPARGRGHAHRAQRTASRRYASPSRTRSHGSVGIPRARSCSRTSPSPAATPRSSADGGSLRRARRRLA